MKSGIQILLAFVFLGICQIANAQLEPQINFITVDTSAHSNGGTVIINFEPNNHSDIAHFRLLRYYDGGHWRDRGLAIPKTGNTYTFTNGEANEQSEGLKLRAIQISDTAASNYSTEHFTIFLETEGEFNICDNSIKAKWNNYVGWNDALQGYNIWLKTSVGSFQKQNDVLITDTVFSIDGLNYNSLYSILIESVSSDGFKSYSNIITYQSPEEKIYNESLFKITGIKNDFSNITLRWNTDNEYELLGYRILGSENKSESFSQIKLVEDNNVETIISSFTNSANIFYKVEAINICKEVIAESNVVQKVVLTSTNNGNNISLNWNNAFFTGEETYSLYMSVDGGDFIEQEDIISDDRNCEIDLIKKSKAGEHENFCFNIKVKSDPFYEALSNSVCMALEPVISMPEAFSPNGDGTNDYIVPKIDYFDVESYRFIIYDRYGGIIFDSNNEHIKWDGKYKNKSVQEGAYLYFLKLSSTTGRSFEKSGMINVVYP